MRPFRDAPIGQKLLRVSLLASGTALVAASVAIVAYDVWDYRRSLVRRVSTDAQIIAANSLSALVFEDDVAARTTLSALRAKPNVVSAAIYKPDGTLFADYARDARRAAPPVVPATGDPSGARFDDGHLLLLHPMLFEGSRIGTVFIRADLRELWSRLRRYAFIVAAVSVASLLLSLRVSALLQRGISGPILRLAGTARDISERKDYSVQAAPGGQDEIGQLIDTFNDMLGQIRARETELEEARATLERRVEERTRELTAVNKELEAFSYSVSHDLRAPLRHIGGFVDLLRRHAAETLDETGRRHLEVIAGAAGRMGQLIDDLLAFSRMGRAEFMSARVDLRPLVAQVAEQLRADNPGRDMRFSFERLPAVRGDPSMLRIAFTNLLANAVKYTRPRERAEIAVGAQGGSDGQVVLYVRDNGVGFEMKYADKLFGVFQRLHRADEFEGTGIGLATVRRIVHRHGGRVWAEGAPGQGATFYLTLPPSEV